MRISEDAEEVIEIVLPRAAGALSDGQLEQVAGGAQTTALGQKTDIIASFSSRGPGPDS